MALVFEWAAAKALANLDKHGVSFEEAGSAFADPLSLTVPDPAHSEGENRLVLLGMSAAGRLIIVVHTERQDRIRLISARKATGRERRNYESKP
jgi:uncharacterized protein